MSGGSVDELMISSVLHGMEPPLDLPQSQSEDVPGISEENSPSGSNVGVSPSNIPSSPRAALAVVHTIAPFKLALGISQTQMTPVADVGDDREIVEPSNAALPPIMSPILTSYPTSNRSVPVLALGLSQTQPAAAHNLAILGVEPTQIAELEEQNAPTYFEIALGITQTQSAHDGGQRNSIYPNDRSMSARSGNAASPVPPPTSLTYSILAANSSASDVDAHLTSPSIVLQPSARRETTVSECTEDVLSRTQVPESPTQQHGESTSSQPTRELRCASGGSPNKLSSVASVYSPGFQYSTSVPSQSASIHVSLGEECSASLEKRQSPLKAALSSVEPGSILPMKSPIADIGWMESRRDVPVVEPSGTAAAEAALMKRLAEIEAREALLRQKEIELAEAMAAVVKGKSDSTVSMRPSLGGSLSAPTATNASYAASSSALPTNAAPTRPLGQRRVARPTAARTGKKVISTSGFDFQSSGSESEDIAHDEDLAATPTPVPARHSPPRNKATLVASTGLSIVETYESKSPTRKPTASSAPPSAPPAPRSAALASRVIHSDESDDDDTPLKELVRREREKKKRAQQQRATTGVSPGSVTTPPTQIMLSPKSHSGHEVGARTVASNRSGPVPSPVRSINLLATPAPEAPRTGATHHAIPRVKADTARGNTQQGDIKSASFRANKASVSAAFGEELEWSSQLDINNPVQRPAMDDSRGGGASSLGAAKLKPGEPSSTPTSIASFLGEDYSDIPMDLFNDDDRPQRSDDRDMYYLRQKRRAWKSTWRSLERMGWFWTKGKDLIDFYYIRPGRTVALGFEGRDYFISADQIIRFLGEVEARYRTLVPLPPSPIMEPTNVSSPDLVEKKSQSEHPKSALHGSIQPRSVTPPKSALPATATPVTGNASVKPSIDIVSAVRTARWGDLWRYLQAAGWLWNYGLKREFVLVWYFKPGVSIDDRSAVAGVDKFAEESGVRDHLIARIKAEGTDSELAKDLSAALLKDEELNAESISAKISKRKVMSRGDTSGEEVEVALSSGVDANDGPSDSRPNKLRKSITKPSADEAAEKKQDDIAQSAPRSSLISTPVFARKDNYFLDESTTSTALGPPPLPRNSLTGALDTKRQSLSADLSASGEMKRRSRVIDGTVEFVDSWSSIGTPMSAGTPMAQIKPSIETQYKIPSSIQRTAKPHGGVTDSLARVSAPVASPRSQALSPWIAAKSVVSASLETSESRGRVVAQPHVTRKPASASAVDTLATDGGNNYAPISSDQLKRFREAFHNVDKEEPIWRESSAGGGGASRTPRGKERVIGSAGSSGASITPVPGAFRGIYFILTGLEDTSPSAAELADLIDKSGGRIIETLEDIELFPNCAAVDADRAKSDHTNYNTSSGSVSGFTNDPGASFSEPRLIAVGNPCKFRRQKYIMALAKGVPILHYSWVLDCICLLNQSQNLLTKASGTSSAHASIQPRSRGGIAPAGGGVRTQALLPVDGYILPSGASVLHSYCIFADCVPSTGILDSALVLNLAGESWAPILRAAGATLCSSLFPIDVSPEALASGMPICPHNCRFAQARSPQSKKPRSLSSDNKSGSGKRMTTAQLLDWYCCGCQKTAPSFMVSRKQYNVSATAAASRGGTASKATDSGGKVMECSNHSYRTPSLILFDSYSLHNYGTNASEGAGNALYDKLRGLVDDSHTPCRIVSIDWFVHTLQLGEQVDFDASAHFSLPRDMDPALRPTVIKRGNERYMVDDVVFYAIPRRRDEDIGVSTSPFSSSRSRLPVDAAGFGGIPQHLQKQPCNHDYDVMVGRITAFSRPVSGGEASGVRIRPLFFSPEGLAMGASGADADETAEAGEQIELNEADFACDSMEEAEVEVEVEVFDAEALVQGEDFRAELQLRRFCLAMRDRWLTIDALVGRPVVISEVAYNDLVYPWCDALVLPTTALFESTYSGRAALGCFQRYVRLRKEREVENSSLRRGTGASSTGSYYHAASQDY